MMYLWVNSSPSTMSNLEEAPLDQSILFLNGLKRDLCPSMHLTVNSNLEQMFLWTQAPSHHDKDWKTFIHATFLNDLLSPAHFLADDYRPGEVTQMV